MFKPVSKTFNQLPTSEALLEAAEREYESGQSLQELERRQDDVLSQLDELDQKLTSILRGLGVTFTASLDTELASIHLADCGDDSDDYSAEIHADFDNDINSDGFDAVIPFVRRKAA